MSCKRADSFIEGADATVRETVDAKKQRFGKDDIAEVFDGASKVIVAKGKKVQTISLRGMDAAEVTEALEGVVIGPTGNLRAPTIRRGKTFLVGFHEDEYSSALT